jgi:hypothetical protein
MSFTPKSSLPNINGFNLGVTFGLEISIDLVIFFFLQLLLNLNFRTA